MSSTDSFVVSQLFNVARHVGYFKLGSEPSQHYVRVSILPLSHRKPRQLRNHNAYISAFACLYFALLFVYVCVCVCMCACVYVSARACMYLRVYFSVIFFNRPVYFQGISFFLKSVYVFAFPS